MHKLISLFNEKFFVREGKLLRKYTESEAGWAENNGYRRVGALGKRYLVHKVIYAIENDYYPIYPDEEVDHIDRNILNNLPSNLRIVNKSKNQHNSGMRKNNTSGIKGVSFDKDSGKWRANICIDGKLKFSKRRDTIEEAILDRTNEVNKLCQN